MLLGTKVEGSKGINLARERNAGLGDMTFRWMIYIAAVIQRLL
jgi:hypothetical protein